MTTLVGDGILHHIFQYEKWIAIEWVELVTLTTCLKTQPGAITSHIVKHPLRRPE